MYSPIWQAVTHTHTHREIYIFIYIYIYIYIYIPIGKIKTFEIKLLSGFLSVNEICRQYSQTFLYNQDYMWLTGELYNFENIVLITFN